MTRIEELKIEVQRLDDLETKEKSRAALGALAESLGCEAVPCQCSIAGVVVTEWRPRLWNGSLGFECFRTERAARIEAMRALISRWA
jgi:hypothetical protein